MWLPFLSLLMSLLACDPDGEAQGVVNSPVSDTTGTPVPDDVELISYTHSIPDGYDQEADERGSIVRIDYDTRDYAEGSGAAWRNTAYVCPIPEYLYNALPFFFPITNEMNRTT